VINFIPRSKLLTTLDQSQILVKNSDFCD